MTIDEQIADLRKQIDVLEKSRVSRPMPPDNWEWLTDDSWGPRLEGYSGDILLEMSAKGSMLVTQYGARELPVAAMCCYIDYLRQIDMAPPVQESSQK